ncbi:MAG TPA: pyridoxamine 5'-phosphate oxidase family protein [Actinocatenispora sp.]
MVRSRAERRADTLRRLATEVDAWVASAYDGAPYLVPLSYRWDGETLLLATAAGTPTARNLRTGGLVRLGLGPTRDVVLVDGTVEPVEPADLPASEGDAFAAATGFDPRTMPAPYLYFRVRPRRIQAWREADEQAGRDLMRGGHWLPDAESGGTA